MFSHDKLISFFGVVYFTLTLITILDLFHSLHCLEFTEHGHQIFFQVPSLDVAVPMHLKGQRARHNSLTEENESLNFVVMLKKGNKQHFKGNQIY